MDAGIHAVRQREKGLKKAKRFSCKVPPACSIMSAGANHYEKIRPADTKWLYRQEQGYVESMKNITLEELAQQRIDEFTGALRKYIL